MPNLGDLLHELVTNLLGVVLGVILIVGAKKRWRFLVDPPESLRFVYSQSLINKLSGSRGATVFCYVVGSLIVLVAGIQALQRIVVLGRGLGYWS